MTRTLLKGGCVLTLGARSQNLPRGDVLVEDDRVVEVGTILRARDAEQVDASDTIVMPGFVDSHRHVWTSLFRNLGDGDPRTAVRAPAWVVGDHYGAEDVYAATLVGLLGAAEAGITTVVDWCEFGISGEHTDAALTAHEDAGLRTIFVHACATGAESAIRWRSQLGRLAASARNPLTGLAAGPAEPQPDAAEQVASDWAVAREFGLRIHTAAGMSASAAGVVSDLAARHLLGRDVTLVHCSHLDAADLDAVAATGTSISVTPSADMAAGVPLPPVQRLIDRGIRIGLGIGSERLAPGDLFAQIRAVISIQHATYFDLKLAGRAGLPRLLTTREVIRYGCIDGANAVGLGKITGSLEPGKQADIVLLRADRPNIFPVNDPIGAVVWGMDTSNVDWLFVAGRAVMRDGELDADLDRVRELTVAAQRRLVSSSGLAAATGAGDPS